MLYNKDTVIPLYSQDFTIILTDSCRELAEHCNLSFREEDLSYAVSFHHTTDKENRIYVVFNPWFEGEYIKIRAGSVAHEVTHVKNYLFLRKGIKNCLVNDEPEAYLAGWITDEITDFLDEVTIEYTNGNKEEA